MHIILPLVCALATSIAADEISYTTLETIVTTIMPSSPIDSVMDSLWSLLPSFPTQLDSWDATVTNNPAYQACAPMSTLVPSSLSSAYAAWDSSATAWISEVASALGNVQPADPLDVDSLYSAWMGDLCADETPFFSSVFHAALATATPPLATATLGSWPSSSSATTGGASSWTVSVLGAVLSGMLAMVALL